MDRARGSSWCGETDLRWRRIRRFACARVIADWPGHRIKDCIILLIADKLDVLPKAPPEAATNVFA